MATPRSTMHCGSVDPGRVFQAVVGAGPLRTELTAVVRPCGFQIEVVRPPGLLSEAGPSFERYWVHAGHGGLRSRAGRFGSGWTMVGGCPPSWGHPLDPLVRIQAAFLRRARNLGRTPRCARATRSAGRVGPAPEVQRALADLRSFLGAVATTFLRSLDPGRVRLARKVAPPMRWWLYDVASCAARDGARLEPLAQAVECIPGVLAFAFALDDPSIEDHARVSDVLEKVAQGVGTARDHARVLADVWWRWIDRAGGSDLDGPTSRERLRERLRWRVRRGHRGGVSAPVGFPPEEAKARQRRFVMRSSRLVDPRLLLVPAPPVWAPEDLPAGPRAVARYFAVVQQTRLHPSHREVAWLFGRPPGQWDPAVSAVISAHALALWHADPTVRAIRVGAIELAMGVTGRRFGRKSDPAKILAATRDFARLLSSSELPVTPIQDLVFEVPGHLRFEAPGVSVRPIGSAVELVAEAARMRNCIGRYARDVACGRRVVCVAVVEGKRYHVSVRRRSLSGFVLEAIRGFANARVPPAVFERLGPWLSAAQIAVRSRRTLRGGARVPLVDGLDVPGGLRRARIRRHAARAQIASDAAAEVRPRRGVAARVSPPVRPAPDEPPDQSASSGGA